MHAEVPRAARQPIYFVGNKREEKELREKKGRGAAEEKGEERDEEQKVGGSEGEGRRRRRTRTRRKRRENKRAIGNRTESFSLACLACYDWISEMAELSLPLSFSPPFDGVLKEEEGKTEEAREREKVRHKKRVTMQKTLHPVARGALAPTFGPKVGL